MNWQERANAYLTIPPNYSDHLGGLRWSFAHDSLVESEGSTFLLIEELLQIFEGVFATSRVPPFPYVLTALYRLKKRDPDLAALFQSHRKATGFSRNLGILLAELCRDLPLALAPPRWLDLRNALESREKWGRPSRPEVVPQPSLSPAETEQLLSKSFVKFDTKALVAWLTHGSAPIHEAEESLAKSVESLPVRIGKLLELAESRPRLIGAAWLVPTLDAALTFPPRRRSHDAIPQGGYADVTTRGLPERLLLSQFALDRDEFIRRFAERELLYFQPEEPHAPQPPERIIVLDQGVRTWGHVRLALAGCAMTLLRRAGKKLGPAFLVQSTVGEPTDLETISVNELADILEASDLTPTPADGIAAALLSHGNRSVPRDVIVLTHPRALAEPSVITALQQREVTDRIYFVTVREDGQTEMIEWSHRGPVPIRAFRIDLEAAENIRSREKPFPMLRLRQRTQPWTGSVEPVGFPFRAGTVAETEILGFDALGSWLVTASREGILHGISLDSESPEVLPRAYLHGEVMKQVEAIFGLHDGVAVCGRLAMPDEIGVRIVSSLDSSVLMSSATVPDMEEWNDWYIVVHYDRVHHVVRIHRLVQATFTAHWYVSKDRTTVGIRPTVPVPPHLPVCVDLYTGNRTTLSPTNQQSTLTDAEPHVLTVRTNWSPDHVVEAVPCLYLDGDAFVLSRVDSPWPRHLPMREGQPLLAGTEIVRAEYANSVLAIATRQKKESRLFVFRGPDVRLVCQLPMFDRGSRLALSPDGSLLAFRSNVHGLSVVETSSTALPRKLATAAKLHNSLKISIRDHDFHPHLGGIQITIGMSNFIHTFDLKTGSLTHELTRGTPPSQSPIHLETVIRYDNQRFRAKEQVAGHHLNLVVDRLGQVLLLNGDTVLVHFLIRRGQAAAIGTNGVCWGAPTLLGCPPTPGAAEKLGEWIKTLGGTAP